MAVIKYTAIEQKEVKIPNCFCGAEPELRDERTLENDDHFYIFIKCPYCGAGSEYWNQVSTFKPRHKCIAQAIEDWTALIERRRRREI